MSENQHNVTPTTNNSTKPPRRRRHFNLIKLALLPTIFSFTMSIMSVLLSIVLIWVIDHTIGISEEGEVLVLNTLSSGTWIGMQISLLCLLLPKLGSLLDSHNLPRFNFKTIQSGIWIGIGILALVSAASIVTAQGINQERITQTVLVVGILSGGIIWNCYFKVLHRAFTKLKEEIINDSKSKDATRHN